MRHQDHSTSGGLQLAVADLPVPRRTHSTLIACAALVLAGVLLSSCATDLVVTATPVPPTLSPTPRSTPLPTVQTQVPFGSTDRPYQLLVVPPPDSAATGKSLEDFLQTNLAVPIKVDVVQSDGDIVAALCSPAP